MLENTIKLNAREFRMPVKPVERDIVAVLAKVKKQVSSLKVLNSE